jgi:hypothetical protein
MSGRWYTLGLLNFLTGGTINFDLQNLTPVYGGGWLQSLYSLLKTSATGYYTVIGDASQKLHEFNHIWQSRMYGNLNFNNYAWQFSFMLNYFWEGSLSAFSGAPFFGRWSDLSGDYNWYEIQGYTHHWF